MPPDRPAWVPLQGDLFCPAAVCDRPGHVLLFARGAAGDLVRAELEEDACGQLRSLGVPVARGGVPVDWPIGACSDVPGRIHLFGRGPDGELLHAREEEGAFGGFECVGVPAASTGRQLIPMGLSGPPAACSVGAGQIDVFAVGHGGALLHAQLGPDGFGEFESLAAPSVAIGGVERQVPVLGAPSACSASGSVAVFVRGMSGDLALRWRDGATWTRWSSLGPPMEPDGLYPAVSVPAPLTGPPAACSVGGRRVEVFARGSRGELLRRSWDGRCWSDYASVGWPAAAGGKRVPLTGACTACWDGASVHVLARAADGFVHHRHWPSAATLVGVQPSTP